MCANPVSVQHWLNSDVALLSIWITGNRDKPLTPAQDGVAGLVEDGREIRVIFVDGLVHTIDRKPVGPYRRSCRSPVFLQNPVVEIGVADYAVAKVAIAENRRNVKRVVKIAEAPRKMILVRKVVVDLDVKLPARTFGENHVVDNWALPPRHP